ncbi:MAG TPA: hypothetical protein VJ603_03495 [Paucimonas sp.]|nr:hypothetical protein [Paucimonas sp.]HJW53770.1 hypothetical protein [Burkholderiaceae bacterium]
MPAYADQAARDKDKVTIHDINVRSDNASQTIYFMVQAIEQPAALQAMLEKGTS